MVIFLTTTTYAEDKTEKIANFIQKNVDMCTCTVTDKELVHCDIQLPMGTDIPTAISAVEKVANTFAQVGRMAATIYYTGFVGSQKVCKFKYDMYSGTVTRDF